jgi:hypothetical protein
MAIPLSLLGALTNIESDLNFPQDAVLQDDIRSKISFYFLQLSFFFFNLKNIPGL